MATVSKFETLRRDHRIELKFKNSNLDDTHTNMLCTNSAILPNDGSTNKIYQIDTRGDAIWIPKYQLKHAWYVDYILRTDCEY